MMRYPNTRYKSRLLTIGLSLAALWLALPLTSAMAQEKTSPSKDLLNRLTASRSNNLKVTFAFNPRFPVEGQAVQFINSSTGDPVSWQWDFGDGMTSTERNPIHVYTASGFRKITLVAASSTSTRKATRTLTVMPPSSPATFVFSPSTPGPGQTVQFADTTSGSPTSWQWNFGDGVTSASKNPSHIFNRTGAYVVTLTASNSSTSKQGSKTVTVSNISVLTSSFTYAPAFPTAGQTVQFTDTSTGSPTAWSWSFGDGTTSTAQNPSHSYASAGSKTVTLSVTNSSGSNAATRTVTVATALTASFSFSPASPAVGQTVQFTDTSSGSPTAWSWNFGDGTTSTAQNPSHSYASAGSKTVTLMVSGSTGSNGVSRSLIVEAALAASFSLNPANPVAGQTVQFTDTSAGSPTTWAWSFGDGATATVRNPSHVFTAAGSFTVTLTVANSTGSNSRSTMLIIAPASTLAADFTYAPSSPAAGQDVQFADASTGSPTAWSWSFGDGAASTIRNPSHAYAAGGSYQAALTITAGTDSRTTTKMILVRSANVIIAASPSYADVYAAITSAQAGDMVMIPAGTATWSQPMPTIRKSLYIIGAGIDQTIINNVYTNGYDNTNPLRAMWSFQPATAAHAATNPAFRLSGMTLNCGNPAGGSPPVAGAADGVALINDYVNYPCTRIRLDHLKIIDAYIAVLRSGLVYGVCDSCYFNATMISNGSTRDVWWYHPYNYGDEYNFYFEDNYWSGDGMQSCVSDGNYSPRYAFRFNTINISNIVRGGTSPMFDQHGNQQSPMWSSQGAEIYGNTIVQGAKSCFFYDQRGGKSLVYNNTFTGTGSAFTTRVREEHADTEQPTGTNERGIAGEHQISGQPQHISDSYYWNNTFNGARVNCDPSTNTAGMFIDYPDGRCPTENVHMWNQKNGFDGTSGMGVGPLANRPLTCTIGVAYWATDTETLYRCTATNVWTEYYRPYTYPHPLRSSLSSAGAGDK
jgi:PKD repeat protein